MSKTKPADFNILGQSIYLPNTTRKLIAFMAVLTFIILIFYLFISNRYSVLKTKDGWIVKCINMENERLIEKKGFVIGFWTPSNETQNYINLKNPEESEMYLWQTKEGHKIKDFEELNVKFADTLKYVFGFGGYRRCNVFGLGNRKAKQGCWWSIGVEGECDDNFLKKFKEVYINFWCPQKKGTKWDNLYLEVIGRSK